MEMSSGLDRRTRTFNAYILAVVFLAGFSVMLLEILGTRVLAPFFGSGLYVWTSLISLTLFSLAVGYYFGGLLADKKPSLPIPSLFLFLAGLWILFVPIISPSITDISRWFGLKGGVIVSSILLFSLPLFFFGTIIPFAVKISAKNLSLLGTSTGKIYAVSTLGSLAGTLITGFILIPNFHLSHILLFTTGTLFFVSWIGYALEKRFIAALLSIIGGVIAISIFLFVAKFFGEKNPQVIYHTESFYGDLKVVDYDMSTLLLMDNIVQTAIPKDKTILRQKGCALSQKYYLELLPYYNLHGQQALLIGLGGGLIPELLSNYGVAVTSVELDPKVVNIAEQFFGFKGDVRIGDGRYFIQNSVKKYAFVILDVYVSDAAPFYMFTKEMFQSVRNVLDENGILAINYVGFPQKTITKSLYRTLKTVFPYIQAYRSEESASLQFIYFFASPKNMSLKFPASSEKDKQWQELAASIDKDRLFYRENEGFVITDEYNPVDFWWAETSFTWREKTQVMLSN